MGYNKMKFKLGLDTIELSVSPLFTIEELREKAKGLRSLTYRVAQGTDMPLEDIFEYCDLNGITVRGSNSKYYPMLKSGDVIHECPYDEYLEALIRGFTIHSMINKMKEDRQGLELWLIDGAEGKVPEGTKPEELLPSPEFLNGYDIVCFSSNNVYNLTGHALFNWEGANLKPGTKVLVISTMEDLWTKGISRKNRLPCFHRIMTPACVDQDKPTAFEELLDSYWNDDSKNRRRMGAWMTVADKDNKEEAVVLYHGFVRGVE